ncbi:hypothetical protein [Arthrobacter rhombi]|uniref:hypothetical protein n=1 Tax=Arthrobacter rhombi TaxID=71253 RepID=UPI003FD40D06
MKKNQSPEKILTRLNLSLSEDVPIRISRHSDPDEPLAGIVLQLAAEWVLIAAIRNGGYFDGYSIIKTGDIRAIKAETTFVPYLRTHQAWPPERPAGTIDLTGPASFLKEIGATATVVALYEEVRRPGMLWIGAPVERGKKSVWILTIAPDATWDTSITKFKFKHLTRVDFSDDYSKAIFELAGAVPPKTADHGEKSEIPN